jgi:MFS family permease
MKYYIQRQLNEYGPYTLADLQRYVAQGSIQITDLTRSEGMTEWTPVSQVIGNIPIPLAAGTAAGAYAGGTGGTVYGGSGTVYDGSTAGFGVQAMPMQGSPIVPVDLHWALVLLIGVFTCGLFTHAWLIVEAAFVRKVKPESKGLLFIILSIAGFLVGGFVNGIMAAVSHGQSTPYGSLFTLAALVLYFVGVFQMKSDLEDYYNSTERINLQLSGVMVFFFNVYYFQHHFSRIAQWKKTGMLAPQG